MPSLLSQFVPSVSSRAKTDFIRSPAVASGDGERKAANCEGSMTRALAVVGGTGVRGDVKRSCAAGGSVADVGGVTCVAGTGGCD
jgi:hypothetical protein